jgi:hypothetical protein
MLKNLIKQLAMRRSRSRHFNRYNGVYVPKDRRLWSDELERELSKAHSRWM